MPSTTRLSSRARARCAAGALLLPLLLGPLSSPPAAAQVREAAPIRVKVKTAKPKVDSFRGEVMNFTPSAVTVRDRHNQALLRTFSFSPELARKVENRRMENGDRVTVRYIRGNDTAVALKGKLRKP